MKSFLNGALLFLITFLIILSCGDDHPTEPEGGSASVFLTNGSSVTIVGKLYVDGDHKGSRTVTTGNQESWTFTIYGSVDGLLEVWVDGDFVDDMTFTISPGDNRSFGFGKGNSSSISNS